MKYADTVLFVACFAARLYLWVPLAQAEQRLPDSSPLFPGVAYFETYDGGSSEEFKQVLFGSETINVAAISQKFYSGGFANDDYSMEYAIEYFSGDLYSIDISNGSTKRIGATQFTNENIPYGPKWNALTGISYAIIPAVILRAVRQRSTRSISSPP